MVDFIETARKARELAAAAAADLRDAGAGKVRELLDEFNASLPVLGEMGYTLADVSVTVGLPPSLQATFDVSHDVTDEAVSAILERHTERKLTTLLIRSLVQARRLQSGIVISGMKPRGVGVEVGLSPHVSIKFSR